ncbi:PAS domain S-box protein [Marinobacter halophilus]|uniref:PAS domain-containing protein n=1 Tax=Marinobacter halophilus TaxID=1323740 RepID=A0A2T1K9P0_9GAMM|nr:PAS domain-containing protein [Marinobacter halophilus]PSF06827.1 hypothetical protein C7H08_17280 [Marinobacter halophilus]GGC75869.1 hypothetical protein GCM10011362_25570 [Marinobacter halophilus]
MADKNGHTHAESHDRLRRCAKDLIDSGVPPVNGGGNLSVDALQLLYERASKPESAADALKLLHELQTYQVELDLLYEQLQANEYEINEELIYYKSLYEQAPAAFLILANDGEIIQGNRAAAELFGRPAAELTGMALSAFLAPGQNNAVEALLQNAAGLQAGKGAAKDSLELIDHGPLSASARSAATGDSILMILTGPMTLSAMP